MNVWSKGDDAAVCLSYLYHGVKATPELLAALSHLTTGSIRMRLQNVQYLATGGASGLSGVAAQTHEVWARVSALLDVGMTPPAMNDKASPVDAVTAAHANYSIRHKRRKPDGAPHIRTSISKTTSRAAVSPRRSCYPAEQWHHCTRSWRVRWPRRGKTAELGRARERIAERYRQLKIG